MVQLVLLERVSKLGIMGDIVNVKPGYARNYLLPQKKALRASEANLQKFEADRGTLEANNIETMKEANSIKEKIDGKSFVIIRSASDSGSLYGSVTNKDISEAANTMNYMVNRKQVILDKPIKELGLHKLSLLLHPEVNASISINVARSQEEAELQESGKTIQELQSEADAAAEFDIAELFDDVGAAARDDEFGNNADTAPAEEDTNVTDIETDK
jgi:large subunit ribosomal protein L9